LTAVLVCLCVKLHAPSTTSFAPARLSWVGPLLFGQTEVYRIPTEISGVYLLHQFAAVIGGYPVFYAGKSTDLRRRLLEHLSDAKAKPGIWALRTGVQAYFSAAAAPIDLLDNIEAGLIRGLNPPCNNCVPTAAPLYVTLPPLRIFLL